MSDKHDKSKISALEEVLGESNKDLVRNIFKIMKSASHLKLKYVVDQSFSQAANSRHSERQFYNDLFKIVTNYVLSEENKSKYGGLMRESFLGHLNLSLDSRISDLYESGLIPKSMNSSLNKMGFNYLGEIMNHTPAGLRDRGTFSKISEKETKNILNNLGYQWPDESKPGFYISPENRKDN